MAIAWHDVAGIAGAGLIVAMYFLSQLGRIDVRSLGFPLTNGIGAALILVSLLFSFNLSAFVIETFWLLISIFGVVRALRH